jgi:predicted transcriptional regulator
MGNYSNKGDAKKLRKMGGRWLRSLRESFELTQVEVARHLGYGYYTFIGQIELGRSRIPPADWKKWAALYGVSNRRFAMQMLKYYDPYVYEMILEGDQTESQ